MALVRECAVRRERSEGQQRSIWLVDVTAEMTRWGVSLLW